ncbi:Flap endonuclease GEN-like protein 1 [Diplodia seriata]|uniref:Flap endonuclease GEN-like protein 1 n=1 Tax=Diplodia seriata TaxID=420778 RepID=A0A1S8BJK0_9PEZI|nr:Flap endonuclease GEN-like protein 1 [Diplodia seriata]
MGIHGIYKEIGPGERIALHKLAVEKFEATGRPLRIAIDTSIWLFQIQSSKGGTNPALRTFYYRLLRLLAHSIHPLFVFDGPNKPPFKRNKRTGPNVASIPEFLAKQLLKQFGFPFHIAPGEAEAECALLQRESIVDAVLSEDVDTLMFGSRVTLRNWSPEQKSSKVPTHVNLYDADRTKSGPAGLDREGMILVALMSGGDYLPEGIPNCGPKLACEAARAGFGSRLCAISKKDTAALQAWRESLIHELRTNESKFFRCKHKALAIPDQFPRADILAYYTKPAVSSREGLERLKRSLRWDQELNFPELRTFTGDAFEWIKVSGAKKFIRNLAPALLVRNLRLRGQAAAEGALSEDPEVIAAEEAALVTSIHGKREHPSTDNTPELRIAFSPIGIVNIDLDAEEPDDELQEDEDEEEEEDGLAGIEDEGGEAPKKRGPYLYDPTKLEKIWIPQSIVKVGAPSKVQDWEQAQQKKTAPKPAKVTKPRASKPVTTGGMQSGALDRFTKITKPGVERPPAKRRSPTAERLDLSKDTEKPKDTSSDLPLASSARTRKPSRVPSSPPRTNKEPVYIDILSSSPVMSTKEKEPQPQPADAHYTSTNVTKRVRTLQPIQTSSSHCTDVQPSQSTAVPETSQPLPVAGDVFKSAASQRVREGRSSRERASRAPKPGQEKGRGNSQPKGPSTPSKRRTQREETHDASPSKRQTTLEESFGTSRVDSPSRARRDPFLAVTERGVTGGTSSFKEVEALDLSRSSPPVCETRAQLDRDGSVEFSSQLPELNGEESRRSSRDRKTNTGERALQATDGNTSKRLKRIGTLNDPKQPSAGTQSESALPDASLGLRRSPRQRRIPPDITSKESIETGRVSLQRRTEPARTGVSRGSSRHPDDLVRQDSGVDGIPSKATGKLGRKQAIKLRESLQGSWKLVDASSIDMVDMTGDGSGQKAGGREKADGRGGRRRAWRQSEVEVLDLTSG